MKTDRLLFEIVPCGEPCTLNGWDIREYEHSYSDQTCIFRGDLSPVRGRERSKRIPRSLYPGYRVRVSER